MKKNRFCKVCKKKLTKIQIENENNCCSAKCMGIFERGRNHWSWIKNLKKRNCKKCKKSLSRQQLIFHRMYCSMECRFLDMRGPKHYRWKRNVKKRFCGVCSKELTRNQILAKRKFCSYECMGKGKQGSKHIRWKKLPVKYCPICKTKLTRIQVRDNQTCCSWKCRNKFYKGERTYQWNVSAKEKFCEICSKKLRRKHAFKKTSRFCSIKCRDIGNLKEKNPRWKNGVSKEPYGFDFDEKLKELIRGRDLYKCQICGVSQKEFIKKLPIHHVDYDKKNNTQNNLLTTCFSCNSKLNSRREYWKQYLTGGEYGL